MRIKVAPGSVRLGATVIVIIVIGVYEGHGNSLLIPFLRSGGTRPERRLDLPVLRSKVDAEAVGGRAQSVSPAAPLRTTATDSASTEKEGLLIF